ncbi:MAG TPA: phasin family protein [Sphingomonas sp.]|nr:phasin family protein [Sphingomonas sp.]
MAPKVVETSPEAAPVEIPAPAAVDAPAADPVTPPTLTPPPPTAAVAADSFMKETDMATTIENATNTTTDKAQAMFAETSERAKGAMVKGTQMIEEMNAFAKGNVEAVVESSKIAAKGMEALGQEVADYTRKSIEQTTAAIKTMASVKSPTELMKLQSDFFRSAFDAMVAETSRSTETMLKLAGEVAQPLSNRMAIAADKMKVAA